MTKHGFWRHTALFRVQPAADVRVGDLVWRRALIVPGALAGPYRVVDAVLLDSGEWLFWVLICGLEDRGIVELTSFSEMFVPKFRM